MDMEEKLKATLRGAGYEPGSGLALEIWKSITLYEKRKARRRLWLSSAFGILSLSAAVPAILLALRDLASSGFYEYFSLAFSSGGAALRHWQELGMSLLESLPVLSVALSLSLLFVFLLSLRQAGKQIMNARLSF